MKCTGCGSVQPPHALHCQNDDALLRTEYLTRRLIPRDLPGMWKFYDWLPVRRPLEGVGAAPVTYKSQGLARELGLRNLYISFSGYWPDRNARMTTCSFKDLEAPPTVERMLERDDRKVLVVASAGNTARAFAEAASAVDLPLVLFVHSAGLQRLWITETPSESLCVVSVNGDYTEAIDLGARLSLQPGFVGEGGARNVARRDGMGVVMLDGALTMKTLPRHYFQAVGSGTGGIAAWEAALRLADDGRFGTTLPRLHLAQNLPCAPLYSYWSGTKPGACNFREMYDDVLYNRKPPYEMKGGVKDALESTKGTVYGITNAEAAEAQRLFEESEEIDILPAAAIAVAALGKAVAAGAVDPKDAVLLNITGGGISHLKEERDQNVLERDLTAEPADLVSDRDLLDKINEVLGRREA